MGLGWCWGDMKNSIWDIQGGVASVEARESPLTWESLEASSKNSLEWKGPSPMAQCQAPLSLASPGQAGTSWPRDTMLGQACLDPLQPKGREVPMCQLQDTCFGERAVEAVSSGSSTSYPTSPGLWPPLWPWEQIPRRRPEGELSGPGLYRAAGCSGHTVVSAVVV